LYWERDLVISFYQLYVFLLLQIRQLSDQGDGSINVMTKGKQRFRIYRVMTAPDGAVSFNLVVFL
jgi:Lon protease-like protein